MFNFNKKELLKKARNITAGVVLATAPVAIEAQNNLPENQEGDTTEIQIPTEVYINKAEELYDILDHAVVGRQNTWDPALKEIYLQGYNCAYKHTYSGDTFHIPDYINTEEQLAYYLFGIINGLNKSDNKKEKEPAKINQSRLDRQRTASMRKTQNRRAATCGKASSWKQFKKANARGDGF